MKQKSQREPFQRNDKRNNEYAHRVSNYYYHEYLKKKKNHPIDFRYPPLLPSTFPFSSSSLPPEKSGIEAPGIAEASATSDKFSHALYSRQVQACIPVRLEWKL